METLGDIKQLTYLCVNNPWRWRDNIENIFKMSSEKEFFQIYYEICFAYHKSSCLTDKDFQWYFEEIFEKRVIDPEIEIKKFGKRGEGMVDHIFEERKKCHNQNLDDTKKIYILWKRIGLQRGFSISFYPDDLDEIFE